jgi:hypothetical protein
VWVGGIGVLVLVEVGDVVGELVRVGVFEVGVFVEVRVGRGVGLDVRVAVCTGVRVDVNVLVGVGV